MALCLCGCGNSPKTKDVVYCRGHNPSSTRSAEQRARNSEAHKGAKNAAKRPSVREKLSQIRRGKKLSPEHVDAIRKALQDKHASNPSLHSLGIPPYDSLSKDLVPIEDVCRHPINPEILLVRCVYCRRWLQPPLNAVYNRISVIKGQQSGSNYFYCDDPNCKRLCTVYRRQKPKHEDQNLGREVQPELREVRLEIDNHTCQREGCDFRDTERTGKGLDCHHIFPVALEPLESADVDNCRIYCKACHIEAHRQPGCSATEIRNLTKC